MTVVLKVSWGYLTMLILLVLLIAVASYALSGLRGDYRQFRDVAYPMLSSAQDITALAYAQDAALTMAAASPTGRE